MKVSRIAALFLIPFLLSNCVSGRKYSEMVLLKDHYKSELDKVQAVQASMDGLEEELSEKERNLQDTRDQLARLSGRFVQLEESDRELSARYEKLMKRHEEQTLLLSRREGELRDSIDLLFNLLELRQTELQRLKVEYSGGTDIPDSLLAHLSMREQELQAFRVRQDEEAELMANLKEQLAERLRSWPDTVIGWRLEGQSIRVVMSGPWLYEHTQDTSAITGVTPAGKRVLRRIAELLKPHPGLDIEIQPFVDGAAVSKLPGIAAREGSLVYKVLEDSGLEAARILIRLSPSRETRTPEEQLIGAEYTVLVIRPEH